MKIRKTKSFWFIANLYGKVLGWPLFAPFHHVMTTLSLHGLGYGNMYTDAWTGEEWFIKKIVAKNSPKVIFDVGANVGKYSTLLTKYTDAKIYAFEPNTSSFERLSQLPEQVIKTNAAVGNKNERKILFFAKEHDGMASLDGRVRQGNELEVEVVTLESFAAKNNIKDIDLLKIDTEGWEREVLDGLGSLRPKMIQFEFDLHHMTRECTLKGFASMLPEYTFYRLLPSSWIKIDPNRYIDNIFIFSNIVAVRKDA